VVAGLATTITIVGASWRVRACFLRSLVDLSLRQTSFSGAREARVALPDFI
jgi:hypothetical protein